MSSFATARAGLALRFNSGDKVGSNDLDQVIDAAMSERRVLLDLLGGPAVYAGGAQTLADLGSAGQSYPPVTLLLLDAAGWAWYFKTTSPATITFNVASTAAGNARLYAVPATLAGVSPAAADARLAQAGFVADDVANGAPLNSFLLGSGTVAASAFTAFMPAATVPAAPLLNITASAGVSSVNTRTGAVTLSASDVGLGNVTNNAQLDSSQLVTSVGSPGSNANVPSEAAVRSAIAAAEAAVTGGMIYQGTWNASTNSPTIASGTGTKGFFYKVATAGTTTVDGCSSWAVGDFIIFDGTAWDRVAGTDGAVSSVVGQIGAITAAPIAAALAGDFVQSIQAGTGGTPLTGAVELIGGANVTITESGEQITIAASGSGGGMANPMTTASDLIVGGASGTPARLALGSVGQALEVVSSADAYTVLLCHFDGANGSTSITDSGIDSHVITPQGSAQISTAQNEFGGSSLYLDGSSGWLSVANSSDFDFGSGNFSIDWWEYRTSYSGSEEVVIARDGVNSIQPWLIGACMGTSAVVCYMSSTGSSWDIASAQSIGTATLNTWIHRAIVRNGSTFTAYQNGTQTSTWTSSAGFPADTNPLAIGHSQGMYYYQGYIDELRISKGIARWTANFTPPTSEYASMLSAAWVATSATVASGDLEATGTLSSGGSYMGGYPGVAWSWASNATQTLNNMTWSASYPTRLVAGVAGRYAITAAATDTNSSSTWGWIAIYVNGALVAQELGTNRSLGSANYVLSAVSKFITLNVGDYLELYYAGNTTPTLGVGTFLQAERLHA